MQRRTDAGTLPIQRADAQVASAGLHEDVGREELPVDEPGGQCGNLLDNGFVPRSQPVEADAARSIIERAVPTMQSRPLDPQAPIRAVVPHWRNGSGCKRQLRPARDAAVHPCQPAADLTPDVEIADFGQG